MASFPFMNEKKLGAGKSLSLQCVALIEQLAKKMKLFKLRTAFATLVILTLAACGGENMNTSDASRPDQLAASAGSGPLPDCAPEACSQLRIIDGLAEESRAAAQLRSAQADDGADTAAAATSPAPAASGAPAPAPTDAAPAVITQ
jgi:hypothetical protein